MNPLNALLKYGRAVCGTVVVDVLQTVVTDQCSDGPAAGGNLLHTAVPNSGAVGQTAVFNVLQALFRNLRVAGDAAGRDPLHPLQGDGCSVGQSAVFYVLKAAVFNGVFCAVPPSLIC